MINVIFFYFFKFVRGCLKMYNCFKNNKFQCYQLLKIRKVGYNRLLQQRKVDNRKRNDHIKNFTLRDKSFSSYKVYYINITTSDK